jgi:hypothetical protein
VDVDADFEVLARTLGDFKYLANIIWRAQIRLFAVVAELRRKEDTFLRLSSLKERPFRESDEGYSEDDAFLDTNSVILYVLLGC